MSVICYIGLGSNLDNPKAQLIAAKNALANIAEVSACSSIYQTAPMGDVPQDDYLNAVVSITTKLAPLALLDALQSIENEQRRKREVRWGPRTIDCDLLLYGQKQIQEPRLIVPHYGLRDRNFVLYPLQEIAPNLHLPDGTAITELIKNCSSQGIKKIDQF